MAQDDRGTVRWPPPESFDEAALERLNQTPPDVWAGGRRVLMVPFGPPRTYRWTAPPHEVWDD